MPKHAFKFPQEVVNRVKQHVRKAIESVATERYRQETNYTAALVKTLEGTAYQGNYGSVVFRSTVFDDRGRNSAESRFGADHAITGIISDGTTTIQKVILVQAKLGSVADLGEGEKDKLASQITKMKQLVGAPKVMEIPERFGQRYPAMISGNKILNGTSYRPMDLPEYFAARVTTTLDGCTQPQIISAVQDSSLSRVEIFAKIIRFK